ncbi:MAG: 4-hydroxythreonine-4-phosphate dehydrogenase PdxA [Alphaproteobacteria bacterium]|tara:strand:+ start:3812 stop:4828 length:1017 start_codon:yes stop_codon:yes gene_type:complete
MKKKPIVLTMGEPSGIATEIAIKSWLKRKKLDLPNFFLLDDFKKVDFINRKFNLKAKLVKISSAKEVNKYFSEYLPILDMEIKLKFILGKPNFKNSRYVLKSIDNSYDLFKKGDVSGLVTLPVCKKSLKKNGFNFCGQTEYLSSLATKKNKKKTNEIMILSTTRPEDKGTNLIVGLITTHVPLKDCLKNVNKKLIEEKISLFDSSLKKFWGVKKPKIAIASVNPHAGEGGLIGREEISLIKPVLNKLKSNFNIKGPLSGDSCFSKDIRKNFDGIICFYHDQGLIPIKLLDFKHSINVTGGLPFLRVSPDHGPAFDIADKNCANSESLCAALEFLNKNV